MAFYSPMEFLRLNEISLPHFLAHPHGRRMVAAGLHLLPPENRIAVFGRLLQRPNIKKMLGSLLDSVENPAREFRDILTDGSKQVDDLSTERGKAFLALARNPKSLKENHGMEVVDLMSPVLTANAICSLLVDPHVSLDAGSVLCANPNCPKDFKEPPRQQDLPLLALGTARYGDLSKPENVDFIINQVLSRDAASSIKGAGARYLLERDDIPESLAGILDRYVASRDYPELCEKAGHREFCKNNPRELRLADIADDRGMIKLPPDVTADNLVKLFDEISSAAAPTWVLEPIEERIKITLHPNAPKCLIETGKKDREGAALVVALGCGDKVTEHAEWFLRREGMPWPMSALRNATPNGLRWAAEGLMADSPKSLPDVLTHPNYPWREDNDAILKAVHTHQSDVIVAARCLFGAAKSNVLFEDVAEKYPGSLLFTENLSSVKLEKIAEVYPELAAFAACHPNGRDIRVANEHDSEIVGRFRGKFASPALAGKSNLGLPGKLSQLIEI